MGSRIVVDGQRIDGTSFIFSDVVLAISALDGINILQNTPSILGALQEDVRVIRAVLDWVEALTIPSHAASSIVHIHHAFCGAIRIRLCGGAGPEYAAIRYHGRGARAAGHYKRGGRAGYVWIACARRLRGQELVETRPSFRLPVTAVLLRKECE